ncbi:stachyose synthase-like [Zingiber officinale]|nr:stachyose synthase-like [Zingiber officinale]
MAPPNEPCELVCDKTLFDDLTDLFSLSDGNLTVNGVKLLSEVPENVTFTSFNATIHASNAPPSLVKEVLSRSHKGGFLGFSLPTSSNRPANSLGRFSGRRFLSIFRFKTWWSTMWVGSRGSDLQMETQWVLFEVPEVGAYVLLLPLLEGSFRSAIFPGDSDHVMLYGESGSSRVRTDSFKALAYVHVGNNPFTLMREAYAAARVHLGTFRLREEKPLPPIVDKFGWCTWDAFYLTVEPIGVWHGVKDFADSGIPLRFLLIDDGWQSINLDCENPNQDTKNLVFCGEQMTARLYRFDEGEEFRKYKGGSLLGSETLSYDKYIPKKVFSKAKELKEATITSNEVKELELKREIGEMLEQTSKLLEDQPGDLGEMGGLGGLIKDLKAKFKGLEDVYVWQALCGAWGGVRPGSTHLDAKLVPGKLSPGLAGTMGDLAVDKILEGGIGLVNPAQAGELYDSMHSYLAGAGVTGVKVDVIHTLEYVSEEYGGRVELAKAYYDGLSKSISKNFNGTGIISSMQQCNDFFFLGTWQVNMGRTGDDFWFEDPNGDPMGVYWLQGAHMINNSFNSLWMGQFMQPDWDMFQSDHACGEFHAAARAICGGPVYVSDAVGSHDFDLIRKLVFNDGTIPKCVHYALPTRDCLFANPLFDEKTALKIWNLNKFGGVIGAFNCQGCGWNPEEKRVKGYSRCYKPITGTVHVADVEWDQVEACTELGEAEEYAVYQHKAKKLILMALNSDVICFTLQPSSFELFSFAPVKKVGTDVEFAAIGLVNMFNCGGTLLEVEVDADAVAVKVKVKVKGGGDLLVYSSRKPRGCCLNGVLVGFKYYVEDGKMMVEVPWAELSGGVSELVVDY